MDDLSDILAEYNTPHPHTTTPESDLATLSTLYQTELSCPALLPYPGPLLDRITNSLTSQLTTLESHPPSAFTAVILQTEIERIKWLLRVYLRVRIAKLDKIPSVDIAADETFWEKLSLEEAGYVKQHVRLLHGFYSRVFLKDFPERLRGMEENRRGEVEDRGAEEAVVVRVRKDFKERLEVGDGESIRLFKDDLVLLRWRYVRDYCVGFVGEEKALVELV